MVMMEEAQMNSTSTRYVYRFGGGVNDGGNGDKNLLGGKGANLDGMAAIGLPVPPGFTITTDMCTRYYQDGGVYPDSLRAEVAELEDSIRTRRALAKAAKDLPAGAVVGKFTEAANASPVFVTVAPCYEAEYAFLKTVRPLVVVPAKPSNPIVIMRRRIL